MPEPDNDFNTGEAHAKEANEVLVSLGVSKEGLTALEVKARQEKYGRNTISGKHKRGVLDIFVDQFRNFLLIMLIAAAVVSFLIGHTLDAIGISIAILLSVIFGFILEYKADESMRALQALQAPKAIVVRNGRTEVIEATELVPGDIIHLEEGEKIPADCRIITASNLEINEAPLTGESLAVVKTSDKTEQAAPLSERINISYAGTFVVHGTGTAVVIAIGDGTELGKIATKLSEIETEETMLQKSLDDIGKKASIASVLAIFIFFIIGIWQEREIIELALLGISLMVAAVPEGLLTVLTIILALGVKRMAASNALVRKLNAVETLGNASVIVVDKTGTITQGKMALSHIFYAGQTYPASEIPEKSKVLEYAAYCNSAKITSAGFAGDEMDKAILHSAELRGINIHSIKKSEPVAFHPLDSIRKRMGVVYDIDGEWMAIIKGAPEIVLGICKEIETDDGNKKIGKAENALVNNAIGALASEGMRLLAIAYKKTNAKKESEIENNLVFLGLIAFSDPPRAEIYETLDVVNKAGIRMMMLTGDNIKTAISIGKDVGLIVHDNEAVEWGKLENCSDQELKKLLDEIKIIARATPMSKLQVVEALIEKGEVVVVTGDGINDALALKKAHVGVVMGSGTDVSKEAGNLVLLDDNIATLITAIKFGRTIFNNIINFIRFQFTTNLAMLTLFFISFFAGLPYLLTPIQILFINIVMDGPPALALGFERSVKGILTEKPRRGKSILSKNLGVSVISSSMFMVAVTLAVFLYYSAHAPDIALTASFAVFVLLQLFNAPNCRFSQDHFYSNMSSNKYLFVTVILLAVLLIGMVQLAEISEIFATTALGLRNWVIIAIAASSILVFEELKKGFFADWVKY